MARRSFGARVAAEAQTWAGTPFVWGQSQKGQGCDCKGLVAGVARNLGRAEEATFYGQFSAYRPDRPVPSALLKEGLVALFNRVDGDLQDGDVLLLEVRRGRTWAAQHLAIVTCGATRAVHAQIAPNDRVKETSLRALLKLCRLNSAWRWRARQGNR
jgi:cell wall-associated NlpC family hydrolase